jgi:glycerol-3-phosphate acyltransferase PlsX
MTARIALDAMGGDHAPRQTVLGALDAAAAGVDVVLVGDTPRLEAELEAAGAVLPIVHAPEHVGMGDDPAAAIREKKGASVTVAARLVSQGEAAGMVSAGSTGAALAASAIVIGRLPGVSRPAIAAFFPIGAPSVVLDVGANLEVKPSTLAEFGVMGSVLAEVHLGIGSPRVALVNIGEEPGKGRDAEREAHKLLAAMPIDFVGNAEGRDLGRGTADVFVTDGFTGNVLLKTVEGTARAVAGVVLESLSQDADPAFREAVGSVLPRLLEVRSLLDPEQHGGAHLVGVKGTVVISHGSSSRVALANALRLAADGAEQGLTSKIEAGLSG